MVAFLKNRRNALIITAVMIVLSLVLSWAISTVRVEYEPLTTNEATKWAKKNYRGFLDLVRDEAGILGKDGRQTAAKYIAQLNYSSGEEIKLGICTVKSLNGVSIEQAAAARFANAPFSWCDGMLMIDAETGEWYAVFAENFEHLAENGLQDVFEDYLGKNIETKEAGKTVAKLLQALPKWYEKQGLSAPDNNEEPLRKLLKPAVIAAIVILVLKDLFGGKRK